MNRKSMVYRALFIICVVVIYFIKSYYHCIVLNLSNPLDGIVEPGSATEVVPLYGSNLCLSCPTGKYLYALRENPDILFIVPDDFSDDDIKNLRDVFLLKGKTIKGNPGVLTLLERISRCKDKSTPYINCHLKTNGDGKVASLNIF